MAKKVLICAGGTGGHLFPAIALARELIAADAEVLFMGGHLTHSPWFKSAEFSFSEVPCAPLPALHPLKIYRSVRGITSGIAQSVRHLRRAEPEIAVGFGSYHAFPVMAACRLRRVPLVLHAGDLLPGKVVRYLAPFAQLTTVQFAESSRFLRGDTLQVAMPVKHGVKVSKERACKHYGLDPERPVALVFGGSQGAEAINRSLLEVAPLLAAQTQILHLTGSLEMAKRAAELYEKEAVRAYVAPFEEQMGLAWSAADVAVCRAGAATIAEAIYYRCPTLLIPYPHAADNHQEINADRLVQLGVARKIAQADLPSRFADEIEQLLNPHQQKQMLVALEQVDNQRSKKKLSEVVLQLMEG